MTNLEKKLIVSIFIFLIVSTIILTLVMGIIFRNLFIDSIIIEDDILLLEDSFEYSLLDTNEGNIYKVKYTFEEDISTCEEQYKNIDLASAKLTINDIRARSTGRLLVECSKENYLKINYKSTIYTDETYLLNKRNISFEKELSIK